MLQSARADSGKFIPLTTAEMAAVLAAGGFSVTERDLDGLLRELVDSGEVAELDYLAGYRWSGPITCTTPSA